MHWHQLRQPAALSAGLAARLTRRLACGAPFLSALVRLRRHRAAEQTLWASQSPGGRLARLGLPLRRRRRLRCRAWLYAALLRRGGLLLGRPSRVQVSGGLLLLRRGLGPTRRRGALAGRGLRGGRGRLGGRAHVLLTSGRVLLHSEARGARPAALLVLLQPDQFHLAAVAAAAPQVELQREARRRDHLEDGPLGLLDLVVLGAARVAGDAHLGVRGGRVGRRRASQTRRWPV
eukprot:scaffold3993_cov101-Isochrysis_galbana.AAC.3